MTADVKMTPQEMAFNNMEIITNAVRSIIIFPCLTMNMDELGDYIHQER